MRHHMKGRKFNRTSEHRQALLANLAAALVKHEKITTTLPKAKDLRGYVEKLITKSRAGDLHARRVVQAQIRDEEAAKKLIDVLGKRYARRPGGYTRVLKAGFRQGDAAAMAVISLVQES
jgi:large subunit ribosomal protein L17